MGQPVSKIEVMSTDMRNEEKQNCNINRGFQPFHREEDIAIGKHPVSKSFINRPDATTTNGTKKYIFPSLVPKREAGIVFPQALFVELKQGSLTLFDVEPKMNSSCD